MTALQFEQTYRDEWAELETLLHDLPTSAMERRRARRGHDDAFHTARLAELYRRACGHLALARGRAYPAHLVDRLERMTALAHQRIYYRPDYGWARLWTLVRVGVPRAVRAHGGYTLAATLAFALPALVMGVLVARRPDLILSIVDAETAASYEQMYSTSARALGRTRTADTDWTMFGFYIRNNIGIAFQCFAGGIFVGVGSLFFLAFNGLFAGALAGYLVSLGLSATFFSFVVTHSAFELTAIVLSGAAGLRLGHSLLAPGRMTRGAALALATREAVVLLYGATGMLIVAAAVEAFWSSAAWIPASVKYPVAVVCWVAVLGYLTRQGRRAA